MALRVWRKLCFHAGISLEMGTPVRAACLIGLALVLSACGGAAGKTRLEPDMLSLSRHYQQAHDYQSLVLLIPGLEFQMQRSEVESLLGKPLVCPTEGQCYYYSTSATHGRCPYGNAPAPGMCLDPSGTQVPGLMPFPLTLVVNYELGSAKGVPAPTDLLRSFYLGPVGE